ncbi:MAG: UDP-phosphate galactose phosphotransferase [Caldilinea sp.]|nr:MAG: UDP-phosphate galactose phosphotransferase [Caldilinea sp.]
MTDRTGQVTHLWSPLMSANAKVVVGRSEKIESQSRQTLRSQRRRYRLFLVLGDAFVLMIAFALAYWLRFSVGLAISQDIVPNPQDYLFLSLLLVPTWLAIFALVGLYDFNILLGGIAEYGRVFNAVTWGIMAVIVYSFLNPEFVIARAWLLYAWVFSTLLLCVFRLTMRRIAYRARRYGYFVSPTVIVGANQEAVALADQLRDSAGSGMEIAGFVSVNGKDAYAPGDQVHGLKVLGALQDLPAILDEYNVEEVVIATTAIDGEQLVALSEQLTSERSDIRMRLSSGLYEVFTTGMEVTTRNAVPLTSLRRLRLTRGEALLKTILDYTVILAALPFLLPLFLVISLLIKLDSPGPVLYRRRVLGVGGKPFDAFKFRTMHVNGNEILEQHPELKLELEKNQKLKNDPRITRVGRFLRRTSLDELPQLINVLLGQMSLVGPRMISPAEHSRYGRMKFNLLTVKPGMTGLWQVSGRSDLSYEERVRLDMFYIRNYSIWMDIQILVFQTLPAVVKGRGAY